MIDSNFDGRTLLIGEASILEVTCGVQQGSVLGPPLYNTYYKDILEIPTQLEVHLIAYADDLGVLVTGRNVETLETLAEQTLSSVVNCLEDKELKLAAHKTEAILLETHITGTVKKDPWVTLLLPRIGGPSECIRRLLGVTLQSRLLYEASIWNDLQEKYQSVQRKLAIQIIGRYHLTASLC
ncbi:hypothetical protein Trydic_g10773 [Trypoxylus dichotomus]